MTVPNVRKGQALSATTWNQLASTVNNLVSASTEKQWGRSIPCTILNRSGSARYGGNVLTVYKGGSVRLAAYKPDEARLAWLNSGFQLDGYAGSTNDYGAPALLIDGVSAGGIGRCIVPGLCAGFVTYVETDLPELCKFDADNGVFVSAASNEVGDWKIIAASDIETGVKRVFAYLVPASIGDLQRQASKLPWGGGGSSDSSSGSGSFEDNIRTYFDCSDAIKDPVLYYDDPDSSSDIPIHPTHAVWDIIHWDSEEGDGQSYGVTYVQLPPLDSDGQPVQTVDFNVYGAQPGSEDLFLKVASGQTAPSGIEVILGATSDDDPNGIDVVTGISCDNGQLVVTKQRIGATIRGLATFTPSTHGIHSDSPQYGKLVRGEPLIHTRPSNAVTTALLDCGDSSSSSSSSSSSESSSSSSSEEPEPDPEQEPEGE